jgi:perosamine synthetase
MWVRKRLDIGWGDLAFAILRCFRSQDAEQTQRRIEQFWSAAGDALTCLSVRTGFDLLLGALKFPPKSEILISALTIPDMVRIIEDHGLVPVPLDLDLATMAPRPESLHRAITPATRAIVVAHLFGGQVAMEPLLELARRHQLLLIEDCAQAFTAGQYRGHPQADASMFSFGPIKTATALGGAVLCVRRPEVLEQMRIAQADYPAQSRWFCVRRLLKYSFLKALSPRLICGAIISVCQAIGYDYDRMINGAVRGFAGADFLRRIRHRPSGPLLALLERRLRTYDVQRLAERAQRGELLARMLGPHMQCPGVQYRAHTHWVFPILAADPHQAVDVLRAAGFDATQGQSMCVVVAPADRPQLQPCAAEDALRRIVYLPIYPEISLAAVSRMADAVLAQCVDQRAALLPVE